MVCASLMVLKWNSSTHIFVIFPTYPRLFLLNTFHLLVVLVQGLEDILRPPLERDLCVLFSFATVLGIQTGRDTKCLAGAGTQTT